MKTTSRALTGCFLFLILTNTYGQLTEFPIASGHHESKTSRAARTQGTNPVFLPFWDDFSYTDQLTTPQASLWAIGGSVFLNNGIGVNPPSKNVVTFDGVDSVGKPYSVNDILAKGFADKMISQPIRMDLVDPALRNTVYLSFYYQVKGRGEAPDAGDQLLVAIKNSSKQWETIFTIENSDALQPDAFYQVLLPIADSRFYHNEFQIRFQNFARLSGPYDTWNVDYVYLNSGRSAGDTSYPDRTVSGSLNSLFAEYYAMPLDHFRENVAGNLKRPAVTLYNLRSGNLQPFDYTTEAVITSRVNKQVTTQKLSLDAAQDPGALLNGLQFTNLTLNKIPDPSAFNPGADSIGITFKFGMSTKDNVTPALNGDYDPARYSPIDFRFNDSTRAKYVLSSYYAYDDGSAEYGAGLNQPGSYLAFKFTSKNSQPDTLSYVDIYFPEFGDNTSQSLELYVWSTLLDAPSTVFLYKQTIQVKRQTQNKFTRYVIDPAPLIKGDYHIGWKQLSSASIPVGLDKNNDNGEKIFFNIGGDWVQNVNVKGTAMVRPGFFRPQRVQLITSVEADRLSPVFPNPTQGTCFLPAEAGNVQVFDQMGRPVYSEAQADRDHTRLIISAGFSGLAIIRYTWRGNYRTEKVMVQAH